MEVCEDDPMGSVVIEEPIEVLEAVTVEEEDVGGIEDNDTAEGEDEVVV